MITFSNTRPPSSAQAVFDAVVLNMKEQGCGSTGSEGYRLYRSPNGTKCAIGSVMLNRDYRSGMEEADVMVIIDLCKSVQWMKPYKKLLDELQLAHDNGTTASNFLPCFLSKAQIIAMCFNLDPAVVY
jgi:hypothetical protein